MHTEARRDQTTPLIVGCIDGGARTLASSSTGPHKTLVMAATLNGAVRSSLSRTPAIAATGTAGEE